MVRIPNLELIKLLMNDSRSSFVDLARHFNVSETAVRKRMKKLEEDGVIMKYTIDVNPRNLGFSLKTMIGIDTEPENYISVMERIGQRDDVISLYSSSGDHMMMMECWFRDSKELAKFTKELESMEGVTKTCPAIIMERIK